MPDLWTVIGRKDGAIQFLDREVEFLGQEFILERFFERRADVYRPVSVNKDTRTIEAVYDRTEER